MMRTKGGCIDTCMDMDLFSLADVARILRCKPYQIVYLISTGHIPEPRLRIGGKRIFTMADIHRIAEKLQIQLAQELAAKGEA